MIEDGDKACQKSRNILHNVGTVVGDLWHMKDGVYVAVLIALPEDSELRKHEDGDFKNKVELSSFQVRYLACFLDFSEQLKFLGTMSINVKARSCFRSVAETKQEQKKHEPNKVTT
ncbi:hypothetical protein SOVF_041460 [Spinacia oleracea]|nr:hypothetical protein SOVF_041460 [Spinacia oleracea]